MDTTDKRRTYMPIGSARLLNIRVILDGVEKYNGMVEKAPDKIKKLKYSEVEMNGNEITYYVYSELN